MAAARAGAALQRLGAAVTYRTASGEATVQAFIRSAVEPSPDDYRAPVHEARYRITFATADVGAPQRGERVLTGTQEYELESVERSDSFTTTVLARRVR